MREISNNRHGKTFELIIILEILSQYKYDEYFLCRKIYNIFMDYCKRMLDHFISYLAYTVIPIILSIQDSLCFCCMFNIISQIILENIKKAKKTKLTYSYWIPSAVNLLSEIFKTLYKKVI